MSVGQRFRLSIAVSVLALSAVGATCDAQQPNLILRRYWSVGVESGNPAQEFGSIAAGALDSSGTAYLLDASNKVVHVFDKNGRFRATIGRKGRGPCEFDAPAEMLHDGGSRLYVLDANNGLAVFSTSPDGATRCLTAKKVPFMATGFCLMNGALFVYGWHDGHVINRFTLDGTLSQSFGDAIDTHDGPASQNGFVRMGRIGCLPNARVVVTTTNSRAYIQAVSMSGQRLWLDSVVDFQARFEKQVRKGFYMVVDPPKGSDNINLIAFGGDSLLMQITRRLKQETVLIRTCFTTVKTGTCSRHVANVPRFLTVNGTKALIISDPDVPTIQLVEIRR